MNGPVPPLTDAGRALAVEHWAWALAFARRHARKLYRRDPEEAEGAAIAAYVEAVARYEPSRASDFRAYAAVRMRWGIMNHMRSVRRAACRDAGWQADRPGHFDDQPTVEVRDLLGLLSDRRRRIVELSAMGHTDREIAGMLAWSKQTVLVERHAAIALLRGKVA